jgi:hypothetical protein
VSTNVELITDALRLLGVVGENQPVTAEQGETGLRKLNQMLELWTEIDIDLGWFEQSDTTADAPLPKWAEMGVTSKLAQALKPVYPSSSLDAWVTDDSMNGYGIIARKSMVEQMEASSMDHLPMGEGHKAAWDITG